MGCCEAAEEIVAGGCLSERRERVAVAEADWKAAMEAILVVCLSSGVVWGCWLGLYDGGIYVRWFAAELEGMGRDRWRTDVDVDVEDG